VRLPAEWERQSGVMMTWPTLEADWKDRLDDVEHSMALIGREISLRQRLLLSCQDAAHARECLAAVGADLSRVHFEEMLLNDIWARDHGPITIEHDGALEILDFTFNGWGLKYGSSQDNQITRRLSERGAFGNTRIRTLNMVLEGGSIESDGKGTLLTTTECLMSPNRNPEYSRAEIERKLGEYCGFSRVLWLDHGMIPGDDTDSHVDTLARLCNDHTIAYVGAKDEDPEVRASLEQMAQQLLTFRTADGSPYRLVELPPPAVVHDDDGMRLPATYANFLIINDAVLVPSYDAPGDEEALSILREVFQDREVVSVNCLGPVLLYGSLHCVTMQLPEGLLA
jgi:agmatine deiminase